MKLTKLEVTGISTPKAITGKPSEDRKAREARMKLFWADKGNATLYNIGRLLAVNVQGKTLAERLVNGEEFEMESIQTVNGQVLPLVPGFKLSLKTLSVWGCPACRSAHGSGVYPSREADVDLLTENKFFYNPVSRSLFTISSTCWGDYVKAIGAATKERFIEVPAPKTAPAKA
jgi:hypothetical protein